MTTANNPQNHVDPVCGMKIGPAQTGIVSTHNGCIFCAEGCRRAFEADPKKYLKNLKRKSWWKRYLERVEKATGGTP